MRRRKQAQIENDITRENTTIDYYNYRVVDQVMIKYKSAYKYENLLKVPYEKFQTFTNRTVTLQTGAVTARIDIRQIKPYHTPNTEQRDPLYETNMRTYM